MILYLDQRDIINLTKNAAKRSEIYAVMQQKDISLGISFAHIIETVTDKEEKRESIIKVVEQLGYAEMTHMVNIFDAEVKNEFYRYLNLLDKIIKISPVSSIFSRTFKLHGFGEIVRHFSKNPSHLADIQQHKKEYENEVRDLLLKLKSQSSEKQLDGEKNNLLNNYINNFLTERNIDLSIKLPPKSLDAREFRKNFSWERCPYLSFYTLFQVLRYRDRSRDPRGDLGDLEHVVIGSLSCDVLCIEKNAYEIINQCQQRKSPTIKAKTFNNLEETIDYLKN